MLMPDKNDPNYKAEMQRFKLDPGSWTTPALAANVQLPARAENYRYPGLKPSPGRFEAIERIRRKVLTHHGIDANRLGMSEKTAHLGEPLFILAGEDESKVDFDSPLALSMLRSAGLLP